MSVTSAVCGHNIALTTFAEILARFHFWRDGAVGLYSTAGTTPWYRRARTHRTWMHINSFGKPSSSQKRLRVEVLQLSKREASSIKLELLSPSQAHEPKVQVSGVPLCLVKKNLEFLDFHIHIRINMKVETPQILWNSEGNTGKNAPLYSIAMQESGVEADGSFSHVLVTAGNTSTINLWKVSFNDSDKDSQEGPSIFQKSTKPLNQIDYLVSLSRHELPVNTVQFSPNGLHLVTAGEAGNIVLWSVPVGKRGGGNGRHFWSSVTKENELTVRVVSTRCEGVCDISWSADSKRFVVGTIDSNVLIFEDKNYAYNQSSPESQQKDSEWQVVFRNGEHTAFVQGVSYDPLGVYIASMGSDRTVRIFPRKSPTKSKKKILRPSNAPRTVAPPQDHQRMITALLTDSKLEMGKTKRIQRRSVPVDETGVQVKQRLFVDESSCESFFRRLSWSADGLFLIAPCALWHQDHADTSPSFSTYLFARHRFDEPYKVLSGLEKVCMIDVYKNFGVASSLRPFSLFCILPRCAYSLLL